MVLLYKKREFRIYGNNDEYIIHNSKKEFSDGHTHINNYKTAKWLIDLAIHKSIPNRKKRYFLESLIRISTDNTYRNLLKREINAYK